MRTYYGNGSGKALMDYNQEILIYKEGRRVFVLHLDGSIEEHENANKRCPYGSGSNFDFWLEYKIIKPANEETLKRFKISEVEDGYYIPANSDGFIESVAELLGNSFNIVHRKIKYTMCRENGNWQSALITDGDLNIYCAAGTPEANNFDNQARNKEIIKVEVEEVESTTSS